MSKAVSIITKNLSQFQKEMASDAKKIQRAGSTAVRVEAFRLMRLLKQEIKKGAPGGRKFLPLTVIGKRSAKAPNRTPLRRLAIPVRYWSELKSRGMVASLGYRANTIVNSRGDFATLSDGKTPSSRSRLSKSWLKIATLHQEGGEVPVYKDKRKALAGMGSRMKNSRRLAAQANFFFLRSETTTFKIPARPIVDPFWGAHKSAASLNIVDNFERKMRGERI